MVLNFVLLTACTGFYFSPDLTVHNMKKAAEAKDAANLSSYVDFPSLREYLKANYYGQLASELARSNKGNAFNTFATSLAATLINPMVDALITPESLAMLMRGEIPGKIQPEGKARNLTLPEGSDTETSTEYKGLNNFIMRVKKKDAAAVPIEFIFKRDGLVSWKLSGLRIN